MLATTASVAPAIHAAGLIKADHSGRGSALYSAPMPPSGTSTKWRASSANVGDEDSAAAMPLAARTATSAGEINLIFANGVCFQPYRIASDTRTIDTAPALCCDSIVESPPSEPTATGSCFMMIVIPMAASMPLITDDGTSAAKRPARTIPSTSWSAPAMMTAVRNGFTPPSRCTSTSTIDVRPAAGPVTESADRLIHGTTSPPTMPAIKPETGGTPQAIAMPRHSGSATRNTTNPATLSSFAWPNMDG